MGKNRGKIGKYSKINLQKKYELLKLTQWGKKNLKEVIILLIKTSELLKINYSTAKTIFFQFQNKKVREKLTFFEDEESKRIEKYDSMEGKKAAGYKLINIRKSECKKISVICTENRCEINEDLSFLKESEKNKKSKIFMNEEGEKSKTVNENVENMDVITGSLNNQSNHPIYLNPENLNSYQNQDQMELTSHWESINNENAIINFGQFPYYVDFMGTSFSFPFLLSVPQ